MSNILCQASFADVDIWETLLQMKTTRCGHSISGAFNLAQETEFPRSEIIRRAASIASGWREYGLFATASLDGDHALSTSATAMHQLRLVGRSCDGLNATIWQRILLANRRVLCPLFPVWHGLQVGTKSAHRWLAVTVVSVAALNGKQT